MRAILKPITDLGPRKIDFSRIFLFMVIIQVFDAGYFNMQSIKFTHLTKEAKLQTQISNE